MGKQAGEAGRDKTEGKTRWVLEGMPYDTPYLDVRI